MFGLKQTEQPTIHAETTVDAYHFIGLVGPHLHKLQQVTQAEAPRIAEAAKRLNAEINAHLGVVE